MTHLADGPAAHDAVMTAIGSAVVFARKGLHDSARTSFGVASARLRVDRSCERPHLRFRLLCCAAYLAYARGRMARAERTIGAAFAQAERLPADRRASARDLARSNLAQIFERTGRVPEALALRELAVREGPSSTNLLNLAFAYADRGAWQRVLATLATPVSYDAADAPNVECLRALAQEQVAARTRRAVGRAV